MELKMMQKNNLITLCFLMLVCNTYGQTFKWGLDGYESNTGGGTYLDVDNSGINLSIDGLVNDTWLNLSGDPFVITGINNDTAAGVTHDYHFEFSEIVDVEFKISEINSDSIATCYYDLLSFSGSPTFLNEQDVIISANQIYPTGPITSPWPEVTVRYYGITDFTIQHGDVNKCNPGKIHIHAIKFESENASLNSVSQNPIISLTNFEIEIQPYNANIKRLTLYDLSGKTHHLPNEFNSNTFHLDIYNLQKGIYVLIIEDTNGKTIPYKFIR